MTGTRCTEDELAKIYLTAKKAVIDHGYIDEIVWQADVQFQLVTTLGFLREAAWVVLSSGMREAVVRLKFEAIERIFGGFDPHWVWQHRETVRQQALEVFSHSGKIAAIIEIARRIRTLNDDDLMGSLLDPEEFLRQFPYIGPVTWRHLAKNLGIAVVKPDRHLVRFAEQMGRSSVDQLCAEISDWVGEPIAVVDVVIWRWAVLETVYCGAHCHRVVTR